MRSCRPSLKRCKSMSPRVGENVWRDLWADMPLLTRGLRTFCVSGLLRAGLVGPFPVKSTEPSLTVGLAPRFCRDFFVMRTLAPAWAKALAVQQTVDRCLRLFPTQADCFSPAREFPGSVRAPVAIPAAPLNRSPDQRTSKSE